MSIDGTDFRINEPRPFDRKWYSHKFHGPGVRYAIAVAINTSLIVWYCGPFCCGEWPDLRIARATFIADMDDEEMAIADGGYRDGYNWFQTPTGFHTPQDRWESVVRARHETVNGHFKKWHILRDIYRHDVSTHGRVFRAIVQITQIEVTTTQPLFNT